MSDRFADAELDIENAAALLEYLRSRGALSPGELPVTRKLEGGVSNRVVLVKPQHGKPFVLKQALEKLRVQVDWFCTPARIEKEALALSYLAELAPAGAIPALLFQDAGQHLLAMEAVPEPHQNWKQLLLAGAIEDVHVEQFGTLLGTIHRRSAERGGELRQIFGDRSIYETLRLEPYYRYTAARVPESTSFLERLIGDTLAAQIALVHGDYSPKNILIHAGKLVLLDCEVVHWGDPAFDIGFSMAHFVGKANHLPQHRPAFAQAAVHYWQTYWNCVSGINWAKEFESRAVRHSLACCLARVAGRSPLEYLTPEQRDRQLQITLALLQDPPATIDAFIGRFIEHLSCPSLKS